MSGEPPSYPSPKMGEGIGEPPWILRRPDKSRVAGQAGLLRMTMKMRLRRTLQNDIKIEAHPLGGPFTKGPGHCPGQLFILLLQNRPRVQQQPVFIYTANYRRVPCAQLRCQGIGA